MIRGNFLTDEERKVLTELARDGMAEHRLARRANAILLLDKGWSCEKVAEVLYLDDDTIWEWHRLFERDGVDGLAGFHYGGRACELTAAQQEELKAWVAKTLPRTTRMVGAWIEQQFGVVPMRSAIASLDERISEALSLRCLSAETTAAPGSSSCCIGSAWSTGSRRRCRASSIRPDSRPSSRTTGRC